jgi:hypothetical protein
MRDFVEQRPVEDRIPGKGVIGGEALGEVVCCDPVLELDGEAKFEERVHPWKTAP